MLKVVSGKIVIVKEKYVQMYVPVKHVQTYGNVCLHWEICSGSLNGDESIKDVA